MTVKTNISVFLALPPFRFFISLCQ